MTLPLFFFYVFSIIAVASALMVIASRNPVHSVLFLILVFINAAGLFMLAGAEFLALILIVVYVGAVAVLFLFVVMMLDVDFAGLRQGMLQYAPIGLVVGLILLLELLLVAGSFVVAPEVASTSVVPIDQTIDNTRALGQVIYTRYVFLFQARGRRAAGRDDRRHRSDAAAQAERQAAGRDDADRRAIPRRRWKSSASNQGRGCNACWQQASASATT